MTNRFECDADMERGFLIVPSVIVVDSLFSAHDWAKAVGIFIAGNILHRFIYRFFPPKKKNNVDHESNKLRI